MNDKIKKWQLFTLFAACAFIQLVALTTGNYRPVYGECNMDPEIGVYLDGCAPEAWEIGTIIGSFRIEELPVLLAEGQIAYLRIAALLMPVIVEIGTVKVLVTKSRN